MAAEARINLDSGAVITSGAVVLIGTTNEATVSFDGLDYIFSVQRFPTSPTSSVSQINEKSLKFSVLGTPAPGGNAWFYPDIGNWFGQQVGLGFVITTFGNATTQIPVWQINYTFTATPRPASITMLAGPVA